MEHVKCKECGVEATTKGPGHSVFIHPFKQSLYESLMVVEEKEDYVLVGVRCIKSDTLEQKVNLLKELFTAEDVNQKALVCQHEWEVVSDDVDKTLREPHP